MIAAYQTHQDSPCSRSVKPSSRPTGAVLRIRQVKADPLMATADWALSRDLTTDDNQKARPRPGGAYPEREVAGRG